MPELTVAVLASAAEPASGATLRSILDQRGLSLEVVVVAAPATPGEPWPDDPRVRWLEGGGTARSLNVAWQASRAPLLMLASGSDVLLPGACRTMRDFLDADPGIGMAHGYWFAVDANGRTTLRAFRRCRERLLAEIPPRLDHRTALLGRRRVIEALPTFRTDLVARLGGFDEVHGDHAAYALAITLLDHAEIRVLPRFLCCRPPGSAMAPPLSARRRLAVCRSLRDAGRARFLSSSRCGPGALAREVLAATLRDAGRLLTTLARFVRRGRAALGARVRYGAGRLQAWLKERLSRWPLELPAAADAERPTLGAPSGVIPKGGRGGAGGGAPPPNAAARGRAEGPVAYVVGRDLLPGQASVRCEIEALRKAGVVVEVVEGDPDQASSGLVRRAMGESPLRLLRVALAVARRRHGTLGAPRGDLDVLRQVLLLASALRERGARHVHAPEADPHAYLAMLAAHLRRLPYSVRAGEDHPCATDGRLPDLLRNARFVVASSRHDEAYLRRSLGSGAIGRLHVVPVGLDPSCFQRTRAPRGEGPPRILAVGRLVERKGIDDLLRACATLRDRGLPFVCDIVGGAQEPEDTNSHILLRRLCRSLDLGDRVRFLGALPFVGVLDAYRGAEVFALPCVVAADGGHDVMPDSLLEAMAMGLPVVSTTVGAVPELIDSGQHGLLVPPRDPGALAGALARLLDDPALRETLGTAARARVEERFDLRLNALAFATLFRA